MRTHLLSIALFAGILGCSNETTNPTDMTSNEPAFCKGTAVAGTCAQPYLADVAECFKPSGTCITNQPMTGVTNTCWSSGAQFSSGKDMVTMNNTGTWKSQNGAKSCMTSDIGASTGGSGLLIKLTTTAGMLSYDTGTGMVVCPNGTMVNLQPAGPFGGCDAFRDLIIIPMQSCTNGTCP